MLDLLDKLLGGGDRNQLGFAADVTNPDTQGLLTEAQRYLALPTNATPDEVLNATERASAEEAQLNLDRKMSQANLRIGRALAGRIGVRQQHQAGVMAIANRIEQGDVRFNKQVGTHLFATATNRAEMNGYQSVMAKAAGMVRL